MSKVLLFAAVTTTALVSLGCGSASEPAANTNVVRKDANIDRANSVGGVIPASSNSASAGVDGNRSIPGITSAPDAANVDSNTRAAGNLAMAERRRVVDVPSSGPAPTPIAVPAAENSTISTSMSKDGSFVETRVFSADPAIAKLEKTLNGNNQSVRIFLRTGKVVQVAADQVPAVNSISLERLHTLAGIRLTPPPPGQTQRGATSSRPKS